MSGDSRQNNKPCAELLPDSLDQWPSFAEVLRRGSVLRKATSWGNTDTYILRTNNGTEYLLKTFARQPKFIRMLFGRMTIKNEYKTLKYLEEKGFRYAPRAFKVMPKGSILMEYIANGIQLQKKEKYSTEECPTTDFFRTLIEVMYTLHEMGVSHGDFRRANIIRTNEDIPILIDWATAVIKEQRKKINFLSRPLYRVMSKSDQYSLAAITESYYPELIDEKLRHFLLNVPWYLRLARFFRQRVYRHFIKNFASKKNTQEDNYDS